MTDQRKILLEQAADIQQATQEGENTAEKVGSFCTNVSNVSVMVPQDGVRTYWVDGDNGSDANNDGSENHPYQTLDKVIEVLGDTILHDTRVYLLAASQPYSSDSLFQNRNLSGFLHLEGVGHEEMVGATVITSHSGIVIDCSGAAPGWTPEQYRGFHCELTDGSGNLFYGTIAENSADTLYICAPKTFNMSPGETIRIVRPAVKLRPTEIWRGESPECQGGPARAFYSRASVGMLWHNLELNAADGDYNTYYLSGSHLFVGFIVSGNAPFFGQSLRMINGNVWSGKWERTGNYLDDQGISDEDQTGWGVSIVDTGDLEYPGVMVIENSYYQGSYVGGPVLFQNSTFAQFSDGYRFTSADNYDNYIEWPYEGCVSLVQSCEVQLLSETFAGNGEQYGGLSGAGDDLPMIYAEEGSSAKVFGPPTVRCFGIGDFAHAKAGRIVVSVTSTFLNGGPRTLRSTEGGVIVLDSGGGTDFSDYGDAIISAVNPLTRPSASWTPGDSVADGAADFTELPKDGGSAIFRLT